MLILGLLLPILFGFLISLVITPHITIFERLALAYGLGFGLLTLGMFFLNVVGIKFSLINTVILILGLMAASLIYLLVRHRISYPSLKRLNVFKKIKQAISSLSIFEGIIIGLLAFFLLANIATAVYWPVWWHDALTVYDFRARVLAETQSLPEAFRSIQYSGYVFFGLPPMTSLVHTWLYLSGWANPKVFYPLLLVSLAIVFYYSVRDFAPRYHSLLFTLIVVITPDLYSYATRAYPHFPITFYFTVSILFLYRWMASQKKGFLFLAGIFLALSSWIRKESNPFFLGSLAVLLLFSLRRRHLFAPFLFTLLYFSIEPLWSLYTRNVFLPHSSAAFSPPLISNILSVVQRAQRFLDPSHWNFIMKFLRAWIGLRYQVALYGLMVIVLLYLDRLRRHLFLFFLVLFNLIIFVLSTYWLLLTWPSWRSAGTSAQRFFLMFIPIVWYLIACLTAKDEAGGKDVVQK